MEHAHSDYGRLAGLPLIADEKTHLLIVGSFPGAESLRESEYYANSRNLFWKFLSAAHGDQYESLEYRIKIARLLVRHVGLWDMYASCRRSGSSDNKILDAVLNDFAVLSKAAPSLRMVAFNGGRAAGCAATLTTLGYSVSVLPSSSPANTQANFSTKAVKWTALIRQYDAPPIQLPTPVVPNRPITAKMIRRSIREGRE